MEDQNPRIYVVTVVNFGDRPAGRIAVAAFRKTAEMSYEEHPIESTMIQNNSYMDDIIHSVNGREKAEEITNNIDKVLDKGGFQIKNWVINGVSQSRSIHLVAEDACGRVLGMLWNPSADIIYFKAKLNFSTKKKKVNFQPNLTRDNVIESIPSELSKRSILTMAYLKDTA